MTHVKRDRLQAGRTNRRRARIGGTAVGLLRVVVGARLVARPEALPQTLGVDSVSARRMAWLVRMLGVRDLTLGLGAAYAGVGRRDLAPWLLAQAVADGGDAVVLALAARERQVSGPRAAALAAMAAGAAVAGVVAARDVAGRPGRSSPGRSGPGRSRAGRSRAGQSRAGQSRAGDS
jgi:hypothetical protein